MAERTDLLALFEREIERLTVEDWQRVYDAKPLGYGSAGFIPLVDREIPWEAKERLTNILQGTLGEKDAAESHGRGRVNFLFHCMDRLDKAVEGIDNRKALNRESFVARFGPFLQVIPPSAVGISGDIAELWDPGVRRPIVERYADLIKSLHGRQTAADARLSDNAARVSLALCLESVGASDARRAELEEMYVALCVFPRFAASVPGKEADPVRGCVNARLKWLGYADAGLAEGERFTIGTGMVRTVAKENERAMAMGALGGLIAFAVGVAALVATGWRLDLLGFVAAVIAGLTGVVGIPIYLKLSARTRYDSLKRNLALVISVVVMISVAAVCGYLYIRFITR